MSGRRLSDVFTFLGDQFPTPPSADQSDFDLALNEVSVLISGLLEYHALSQAVFKGKIIFTSVNDRSCVDLFHGYGL